MEQNKLEREGKPFAAGEWKAGLFSS